MHPELVEYCKVDTTSKCCVGGIKSSPLAMVVILIELTKVFATLGLCKEDDIALVKVICAYIVCVCVCACMGQHSEHWPCNHEVPGLLPSDAWLPLFLFNTWVLTGVKEIMVELAETLESFWTAI